MRAFVELVARAPVRVQVKLLVAFLAIAMLLILMGAIGLQVLRGVSERTEDLIGLQRKIEAYRQVQRDTISQLYGVASALLSSDERTLSRTLRQLNQFGYDVDRLQFVAKDEVELLGRFRQDYDQFVEIVTHGVEMIRAGRAAEAREMQAIQAAPLADRLERLTNQLVNKAEADMVAGIETSRQVYENSQRIIIAFALGSILLALALGYTISWSLISPVKQIEAQLKQVAAGDFTHSVDIINRDELGTLGAGVNKMSEKLGQLYQQLRERTEEVENLNHHLEQRVTDQVDEIERMSRLRRFLPPQVADLIVASGSEKQLESHRREITALFCDLRGFTGFTESADAEDVMALLRDYHAAIGEIIIKYNGTLERYAGDGVMVVFNDPVPVENPALQAVLMALEVRDALGALTATWSRLGHEIGFGIGIAHGFATLGTIGFEGRFDYAAIGTVSNVASRLCDEAKPGQILISPRVLMKVEHAVKVEPVGEFELKGIRRPLAAYNVVGTA